MKIKTVLLIISAVLTLGICGVMNMYLLPAIESTTEGLKAFDMNTFGYTFENAKQFVSLLSDKGLDLYLHKQLPLDFFYPVCYTTFFVLSFQALKKQRKWLLILPALLFVLDYTENIFSIIMLKTDFTKVISTFASCVTVCKSMIMYAIFIILAVYLALYLKNRFSKKA